MAVSTGADLLVVNGAPLVDVTTPRRWESLALVMQDGLANAEAVRPACRDGA